MQTTKYGRGVLDSTGILTLSLQLTSALSRSLGSPNPEPAFRASSQVTDVTFQGCSLQVSFALLDNRVKLSIVRSSPAATTLFGFLLSRLADFPRTAGLALSVVPIHGFTKRLGSMQKRGEKIGILSKRLSIGTCGSCQDLLLRRQIRSPESVCGEICVAKTTKTRPDLCCLPSVLRRLHILEADL